MTEITKKSLHERFTASEEKLGAYWGDYQTGERLEDFSEDPDLFDGATLLPDGSSLSCCTNGAAFVCEQLGEGEIYGFKYDDNPVECDNVKWSFGHDFAVIRSRFIVDPWASLFSGASEKGVLDLRDPKDHPEIKRIYGDPSKWELRLFTSRLPPENWPQGCDCYVRQTDERFPASKKLRLATKQNSYDLSP